MGKLQTPVFYVDGIRSVDRLCRQLSQDERVPEASKQRAREIASELITIMAAAQAGKTRSGNA